MIISKTISTSIGLANFTVISHEHFLIEDLKIHENPSPVKHGGFVGAKLEVLLHNWRLRSGSSVHVSASLDLSDESF